jgi:hypothetical protein
LSFFSFEINIPLKYLIKYYGEKVTRKNCRDRKQRRSFSTKHCIRIRKEESRKME